jgi:hypothetical protein
MSGKPKFNYDDDAFYMEIMANAMKGLTDSQISFALEDKFNQTLTAEVFSKMKNGKYEGWDEEQNKVRGGRLSQALAHGREKINSIIRGSYLKAALGGKMIHSKSTVVRRIRLSDGTETDNQEVQETNSEQELAPNLQALSTWLFNHDLEWKKAVIEGKKLDITTDGDAISQVTVFQLPDNGRD